MRSELAPHGVQVIGVYVGLCRYRYHQRPDSAEVAAGRRHPGVLDGMVGANEVLADEMTRRVRAG